MPFEMDSTISIHAPARGGDRVGFPSDGLTKKISIHAPARGATLPAPCQDHGQHHFNPRPPRGGRL